MYIKLSGTFFKITANISLEAVKLTYSNHRCEISSREEYQNSYSYRENGGRDAIMIWSEDIKEQHQNVCLGRPYDLYRLDNL